MDADDKSLLTAEYALGLLDAAERADFDHMLQRDPALRADLAFWQDQLSSLVPDEAEPVPPRILDNIHNDLFGTAPKSVLDEIMLPANRPLLIAVGAAKVVLIAAVLWMLNGG